MKTRLEKSAEQQLHECRFTQVLHGEDGMITYGTIFSVMVLLIMISLITNSFISVNRKLETQNAADAVAYSSAVWLARGMNSVTATNHIIGELNALYTLHHAIGGKYLDEHSQNDRNNQSELESLNAAIEGAFIPANAGTTPANSNHKQRITENPSADLNSMLYEAKKQLKIIYTTALVAHAIGTGMELFGTLPPVIAAGKVLQAISLVFEWKVFQEYLFLDGIEMLAHSLKVPKKAIPTIIDVVYLFQELEVVVRVPVQAYRAAEKIAKKHNSQTDGFVRGDIPGVPDNFNLNELLDEFTSIYPKLPIEKENTEQEEKSQMLRATFPWVAHWRYSPNRILRYTCTLSGAEGSYRKWSNTYARQASEWLRFEKPNSGNGNVKYQNELTIENMRNPWEGPGEAGRDVRLFVMYDLNPTQASNNSPPEYIDKSEELWNQDTYEGARRADEIFCIIGFATNPKPMIFLSLIHI